MTAYIDHDGSLVVELPDLTGLGTEDRPWRTLPCCRCRDGTLSDFRVTVDPGRVDEELCVGCAQQLLNRRLRRPGSIGVAPLSERAWGPDCQLDWSRAWTT
jgi:hypothetical protein